MRATIPFFIALQFLTRLPVRLRKTPNARQTGASLPYYPAVGALLGLALAALCLALEQAPALLRAALLVMVWVLLTGALHLDGLADSVDAWIGGHGDRVPTLAIMKDPYSGPAAVVAVVVVLLTKFAALASIDPPDAYLLLLLPMLARTSVVALFLTTPYVRKSGLGAALSTHAPFAASVVAIVVALTVVIFFARLPGVLLLGVYAAVLVVARFAMLRRLGGTTGDTAGALVEVSETTGLVVMVLLV